jgi:hypothetical protein
MAQFTQNQNGLRVFLMGDTADGGARYQVVCPSHGQYVTFRLSASDMLSAYDVRHVVEQKAFKAMETGCGGCVADAVKLPPTRWPEGAEL